MNFGGKSHRFAETLGRLERARHGHGVGPPPAKVRAAGQRSR
jgi:hypothetical protein